MSVLMVNDWIDFTEMKALLLMETSKPLFFLEKSDT
jgi:hypothetical protein